LLHTGHTLVPAEFVHAYSNNCYVAHQSLLIRSV
jgi:hypothetical protein